MKVYSIIGGVNGSGKSSLRGTLVAQRNDMGVIVDTDAITASCGGDKILGGKKAIKIINACLEKGCNLTQETTLSGKMIEKTISRAKEKGYYIKLYYVAVGTVEESLARIKNRVAKGGHNIPAEDVIRRYNKRFVDLSRILPLCDEAQFYDNENGFIQVAEYSNGEITKKGDAVPDWLVELMEMCNVQTSLLEDDENMRY